MALLMVCLGCNRAKKADSGARNEGPKQAQAADWPVFHVDPATTGSISGVIRYAGKRPAAKPIDMSEDAACVEAHHGRPVDQSLMVSQKGAVADAFVYIESGLEGKNFEAPGTPVAIDQNGCWFHPRVLGIQTGQLLQVTNSDPVTHNIHPMAQINREWNHSQGAGDAPLERKFTKPEVMIRVKCNIHSWMHAYIGVVASPYFAVSKDDGSYRIAGVPAGTYTIGIWQEKLGVVERKVTVAPQTQVKLDVTLKEPHE